MDNDKIPCVLAVRRNSDGAVRVSPEDWNYFNDDIWSEGNYSCDCNRHLFFQRAANEEITEVRRCGEGAYSLKITNKETGEVLYSEWGEA